MAKPELGQKRQCQNCGAKFFDLNKSPIVCPKCATVFQAAPTRTPPRAQAADDEEVAAPTAAELVPLEEADAPADKAAEGAEDDIDLGDEGTEDDAFLEEEEEEDDDVSGLIDGDIENDEES